MRGLPDRDSPLPPLPPLPPLGSWLGLDVAHGRSRRTAPLREDERHTMKRWPERPQCRARRPLGSVEAPTALLVLADGTVIEGKGAGATGIAVGEVCFNTAMTGYQEILTDPSYAGQIITFTFPHIGNVGTNAEDIETAHLARGGRARLRAARADHRAVELSRHARPRRLAESARHHRHHRRRHARADRADPRQGHAERGDRACARRQIRSRCAEARGRRLARHGRARPRQGRHLRPELQLGRDRVALGRRLRPAGRAALPCRRHRLRAEAQHPARAGGRRLPADRRAGDGHRRGDPRAEARRRVPVQRPRRSGGDRRLCRAGDQEAGRLGPAGVRHLPRPSDAGARARRHHRQDASGPSRREPSGEGLHHRQSRDHLDESRLRRRPRQPAGKCRGNACLAVRRLECRAEAEGPAGVLGAVPPRGLARPAGQPLSLHPLRRS